MPRFAALIALVALLACGCGGQARHPPARAAQRAPSPSPAARVRVPEACTDVWVGPRRGGTWEAGRNWSAHHEPGPRDQACLDRGIGVVIGRGHHRVGSVIAGGSLTVAGGRLDVVDPSWRSEIGGVDVVTGSLRSNAPVEITRRVAIRRRGRLLVDLVLSPAAYVVTRVPVKGSSSRERAVTQLARIACGPHSPQAVSACAGEDTPLLRSVRAAWRQFAELLNSAGWGPGPQPEQDLAAAMLSRTVCRAPECLAIIDRLVRGSTPMSARMTETVVVGGRAFGYIGFLKTELVRERGAWRIARLRHWIDR